MGKVLRIREVGDPILKNKCDDVDTSNLTDEVLDIIEDMKETLDFTAGYGLAAPQIGVNKKIVIIQINKENCIYQEAEDVETTVMINPSWKKLNEEKYEEYEGCLSVPRIRGKVARYKHIEVIYYTETGEKVVKEAHGFLARDIQHECDHLDGIIFLDKVIPNTFATKEMISKYNLNIL